MLNGSTMILNASVTGSKGLGSVLCYQQASRRSFARTCVLDLRRRIRINAISAGVIPTSGYTTAPLTGAQFDQFVQGAISNIPFEGAGTVEEVAKAVRFLASDDSSYVNGVKLFADGRWHRFENEH
jgi:NAD(P)-dependent dehydrogenase (short-subunit alcohol dehydrogenase family)